jgi:hypothetical protein
MANTVTEQRANWWPAAVGLLASVWIGLAVYFFGQWLELGWQIWALSYDGTPAGERALAAVEDASAAARDHTLVAMAVGSLVTAIVAGIGRLRATAIAFTVFAVPALLLGALVWTYSARHDTTPPPQPAHNQCSGHNRCPGG